MLVDFAAKDYVWDVLRSETTMNSTFFNCFISFFFNIFNFLHQRVVFYDFRCIYKWINTFTELKRVLEMELLNILVYFSHKLTS